MTATEGQALKEAGQAASLATLTEETWAAFEAIIRAVPTGHQLQANGVRDLLDLAQIPPSARGALFSTAVKRGLLAPVVTWDGHEVRVKSTGASAHAATVRLYVRCH